MNKTSSYLIHNLWWMLPLAIVLFLWQHTSPIILMLIFAYLGRIILNPIVKSKKTQLADMTNKQAEIKQFQKDIKARKKRPHPPTILR